MNQQYAAMTGEQRQTNFASSEREEVMKKLKDLNLQAQRNRKQEGSRHEIKANKEPMHFDFQGIVRPVKGLQTSGECERTRDGNIISTHKAESGRVSGKDSKLPKEEDWLDDAVDLEDFDNLDGFEKLEESVRLNDFHTPGGVGTSNISVEPERSSDISVKPKRSPDIPKPDQDDITSSIWEKSKVNDIYDIDLIIRSMLKRSKNLSPYKLLIDYTEEELAAVIDGKLYMNKAATIKFLEKAEAANRIGRTQEAAKLWETICFYSVDAGYMNVAFWNLVGQVYKPDLDKVKEILGIMTKKEKRLLKLVRGIIGKERYEYEY